MNGPHCRERKRLGDLEVYIAREQTDFLAKDNHAGQVLDFHALATRAELG